MKPKGKLNSELGKACYIMSISTGLFCSWGDISGAYLKLRGRSEGNGRDPRDGVSVAYDEAVGHDALGAQAGVVRLRKGKRKGS